jgi:GMP synthase (glutamine-hydrolysing)
VQFHPEVDGAALDRWYASYGDWLGQAGVREADARAADAEHEHAQAELGRRLFGAFAREIVRRAAGTRAGTAAG